MRRRFYVSAELNAAAGQDAATTDTAGGSDERDILAADQDVGQDGPDRNGATAAELRYGWWSSLSSQGKPAEPPDIPWTNPLLPPAPRDDGDDVPRPVSHASQSAPIIHVIANTSSVKHDTSTNDPTLSPPPNSSPSPVDRFITPRGIEENSFTDSADVELDANSDWIFNIIIQQQRKQRSAYIAPDVNWLRDLVPKVVEVVDKPETLIKETVFNAIDDDKVVQAGHIEDRQIFVNVVKSRVESEDEVPQILTHLRDLMQTGGPAVDSIRSEFHNLNDRRQNSLIINVIIFNVAADITTTTTTEKASKINPTALFRDSYIEALEESHNNRRVTTAAPVVVNVATTAAPKHEHVKKPHHAKTPTGPPYSPPKGPYYIKGASASTTRPLTIMEKDYLRPSKPVVQQTIIKPVIQAVEAEEGTLFDSQPFDDAVFPDEEDTFGAGLTLTGPQPPAPPEEELPGPPAPPTTKRPTTTKKPGRRPGGLVPSAVGNLATSAGDVVRNRIRTMGLIGVPVMAGLAGTASLWLPALAALGRKKRSVEEDELQISRERVIKDPNMLALLTGKRYMNITKELLRESIDNWKDRDQEAGSKTEAVTNREGDSYIEALELSNSNRKPSAVATTADPKGQHHHDKSTSDVKISTPPYSVPNGPYYMKGENSSTTRPQTNMESDYLRPAKPVIQQTIIQHIVRPVIQAIEVEDEKFFNSQQFDEVFPDEEPLGAVLTITEPQPPAPPEPKPPAPASSTTTPPPTGKPTNTRRPANGIPSVVESLANSASNLALSAGEAVRNRIRTIGLVGVPLMGGLASTAGLWIPALTALGRKKRSVEEDEPQVNRERAIDDPSLLALLMGKRYMNITKESLQESIDNWKNRDQEAGNGAALLGQSGATKLSSTSRPLWFRLQPSPRTTTTPVETLPTTRTTFKRSTDSMEDGTTTRKSPVFYSAAFDEEPEEAEPEEAEPEEAGPEEAGPEEAEPAEDQIEDREDVISEYTDAPEPSTSSTTTSDYETEETEAREAYPVTISSYKIPGGGFDFDIVANFVKSTLSKMVTPDGSSNKENVFMVKAPSIVNNSQPLSTLLFKNNINRVPSSGGSTQPLTVFTADPIMPMRIEENATNSPVTYLSIRPVVKQPAKTTTTSTQTSSEYDTSDMDNESDIPSSENVGVPLEFYDEDGSTYYSKEVLTQTVPYSEPFVKSTNRPMGAQWMLNPFELPNTLRPMTSDEMIRSSTTGSTRPSSLLTIADFKTPKPPPPVQVSNGPIPITTLKFNHGGIVTTAPLQDFSTLTGESSLVSDTVDKQNILNGLLKGASTIPVAGQTNRPGSIFPSNFGDTGTDLNGMYAGSNFNTATYDPFSTTGVSDELDVTSLISQLQTNLTTGLVTRPPSGGLHFVNTSTDIVIINPFGDVTPSSIFAPLEVEAVFAEDEGVSVDVGNPSPGDLFVESIPAVSNLANFFFPVVSSGSTSSDGTSSSVSTSSDTTSGSGTTSTFISNFSATTGIGSLASLGVIAIATVALLAFSLPIWVPIVGKKKRRTYGPARKKAQKPPPKKTYGYPPPKKTYGEPPPNHYKDLDHDRLYSEELVPHQPTLDDLYYAEPSSGPAPEENQDEDYVFRDSVPLNTDGLFGDPGPLNSEDIYGPPATIFLNSRRRRRSAFKPSRIH